MFYMQYKIIYIVVQEFNFFFFWKDWLFYSLKKFLRIYWKKIQIKLHVTEQGAKNT